MDKFQCDTTKDGGCNRQATEVTSIQPPNGLAAAAFRCPAHSLKSVIPAIQDVLVGWRFVTFDLPG